MQSKTIKILTLLCLGLALINSARAQLADSITKRFERYNHHVVSEKLFLHLDKSNFVTGETLWLKVYCVEASSNKLLDLSKVAYIELTDRTGKAVLQTKVALKAGMGSGTVFIPATLDSDNYTVTAYTSWMKNSPKEYFFKQNISVFNPFRKTKHANTSPVDHELDIQFLPEGGTLLAGVHTKIAFRGVNASGKGVPFKGEILDASDSVILRFEPSRFGLGTFQLQPEAGKRYRARISYGSGKNQEIALPDVLDSGFAMTTTDEGEHYRVAISARNFDEPVVYLFVHAGNKTILSSAAYLKNSAAAFEIPKGKLPEGITHITLFDNKLSPVAERLIYRKPAAARPVSISLDRDTYGKRRKVEITIDLKSGRKDETAEFSVSVSRRDSLASIDLHDIYSYLLLTSDLHGEIESPDYYFTSGSSEDFDLLMLTHGWRRFEWKSVLQSDFSHRYLPEVEGPILQGTLVDETGKPAAGIGTYLSSPSRKIQLYTSVSKKNGNISYALKDVVGKTKIYLQTNFAKDSLYEFKFENPFLPQSPGSSLPLLNIDKNMSQTLLSRSVAMQVQDIFDETQYLQPVLNDTISFYGKPDESYLLDDYTRFPVMEEVMREYVKGVWLRKRQNEFYFLTVDNINKSVFNSNPLILLDGVPVFRVNDIMNINPLKVKKVDVLTRRFFHGNIAFDGIVSFSTYTNDLAGIVMDRRNLVIDYEGIQAKRIFFKPVYDTERQRSNRQADQRSLLLWEPDGRLQQGQNAMHCFTSDLPGTYQINIQGLTSAGTPISATHTFTVSDYNN